MALHVVVSCDKDGHRVPMVGQFSGPAQAEPGKAPVECPNRQVLSFNEAGADSVSAGTTRLYFECDANKRCRRITPARLHFASRRGVVLLQDGVIETLQEVMPDGIGICFPPIACDLHPALDPRSQVRDKGVGVFIIAFAGVVRNDQLGPGVQRQECIEIPALSLARGNAALTNANPRPQLVDLDCLSGNVANSMVKEGRALLSKGLQHGQNRVDMATDQPARGPHADAFRQELDDLDRLVVVNPQFIQGLDLGKGFAAPHAAEALDDPILVLEMAEPLGRAGTTVTIQLAFPGKAK